MMRWGVHVQLGYAYYILGVKGFYASNSSATCPNCWAVRATALRTRMEEAVAMPEKARGMGVCAH